MKTYIQMILKNYSRIIANHVVGNFGLMLVSKDWESAESLQGKINSSFVARNRGVLHIGAHKGQEASFYDQCSASVLWIEAIPEIYNELLIQIRKYPRQIAIQALLGDSNLDSIPFHISSNDAQSSSIYEFGSEVGFEDLSMTSVINLPMVRLDAILSKSDVKKYPHWILDVQGAELMVLAGAGDLLESCNSIYVEVSTREVYKGGTQYPEIKKFLTERGFAQLWEPEKLGHENILFSRLH